MLRRLLLVSTAPIWGPVLGVQSMLFCFLLFPGSLIEWIFTGQGMIEGYWGRALTKCMGLDWEIEFLFGDDV